MVVDIGGGHEPKSAVLSLGGIVYSRSVRVGGDKMDEAIIAYIRRHQNLLIGEASSERIKKEIGSAAPPADGNGVTLDIKGRDLLNGVPKEITITPAPHRRSACRPVGAIVECGEGGARSDASGACGRYRRQGHRAHRRRLASGGAGPGLREETGLPVSIADDPLSPAWRSARDGFWRTRKACGTCCRRRSDRGVVRES